MRVIFAGTPEFAASALLSVVRSRHSVALVLTRPDRPAGRGLQVQPSEVKVRALSLGLPVRQPATLKAPEVWPTLAEVSADVMVVAAYGLILPQAVLDIPRHGALNIHASLLPRWRGAAPIQRAILAGDRQTGISIMQMDAGLDTGPVLMREATPLSADDTAGTLHDRLASIGARLVVTALDRLEEGTLTSTPQPAEGVTYAAKIEKSEARIDWTADAATVDRQVRAFNPVPGAHTTVRGAGLKLWKARLENGAAASPGEIVSLSDEGWVVSCGSGALLILEAQRAGGRRLPAGELARGLGLRPGERLGG